jgi:hypothetical protein
MSEAPRARPIAELAPSRELALRFAWVALIAACLIRSRPYLGIVHDGIQYAAQALEHLHPEIYRNDIYFRLGSQDQYTLFSPVFAFLVAHMGLGHAYMALVVVFLALFLGASFLLARALVPAGLQGVAMLLIAASAGHYGPHRIFRMAEAVVSPRPLAEVGTLLALLLLFRGRQYAALAVLFVCAVLHPLVALAGMLYWAVYVLLSGGDRRLLFVLALAPFAAALAGLSPFDQLFTLFDAEWFQRVYEMNRHLFIAYWTPDDWSRVAFDLAALYMVVRVGEERTRVVFRAAIWTAVLAVLATFLGADLLHDVLVTNLQPWRALWIVHWLALAATPIVVMRLWSEGNAGRLVAGLLLFAFATRGLTTSLGASLLAAALFAGRAQVALGARLSAVLLITLAGGALASWIASDRALFASPLFPVASAEIPILRVLSRPFPLVVIAAAVYWFALRRRAERTAAGLAVVLLALSIVIWDQRSPFARYVDSATPGEHPFARIIPPGDQVWWYGENLGDGRNLILSWLVLERASYVSAFQHVGQHFDRARTLELHRRDELVLPFAFQMSLCGVMELVDPKEQCQPEFDALEDLCRDAGGLDYLILDTNYPGKWVASWTPPLDAGGPVPSYYLYACKSLVAR